MKSCTKLHFKTNFLLSISFGKLWDMHTQGFHIYQKLNFYLAFGVFSFCLLLIILYHLPQKLLHIINNVTQKNSGKNFSFTNVEGFFLYTIHRLSHIVWSPTPPLEFWCPGNVLDDICLCEALKTISSEIVW